MKKLPYILFAIVAIAILAGIIWEAKEKRSAGDGTVVSNDDSSSKRMNEGAVNIDGRTSSDVDGNGQYTSSYGNGGTSQPYKAPTVVSPGTTGTVAGPTGTPYQTTAASTATATTNSYSTYKPASATNTTDGSLPASDTLSPNAPTGMAFGGSGKFQWYRQGNLTWRINTQTGATCIDFATMDEWAKPIVYSHGCGSAS